MRSRGSAAASPIRIGAVLLLLSLLGPAGSARAEDLSPFLGLDAAACDKLDDKNLQVGPPDAEIVAACAALRRGAVLGQRFSGGPAAVGLALLSVVLVYAVLGAPLRAVAGLTGRATGRSAAVLSVETALAFLVRAGVGLLVLSILSLPYATAAGCVVVLVVLILSLRAPRAAPSEHATAPPASLSSAVLADVINDVAAGVAGILALALLLRRDPWWLGVGILLAAAASLPAVVSARRRLRRDPVARLAATAVLGAIFGAIALSEPDLADAVGDALAPVLASALVFAAAVVGAGWIARANPRSNPAAS